MLKIPGDAGSRLMIQLVGGGRVKMREGKGEGGRVPGGYQQGPVRARVTSVVG